MLDEFLIFDPLLLDLFGLGPRRGEIDLLLLEFFGLGLCWRFDNLRLGLSLQLDLLELGFRGSETGP